MSVVWPLIGPRAGGTAVTITGHHLDTGGGDVHVLFDHVPCHVDRSVALCALTLTNAIHTHNRLTAFCPGLPG